jgi:hypothetical protein
MSSGRNAQGEKKCTYGTGHWAPEAAFYKNATKPDGLNDICRYHQGMVDAKNKDR